MDINSQLHSYVTEFTLHSHVTEFTTHRTTLCFHELIHNLENLTTRNFIELIIAENSQKFCARKFLSS